MLYSKLDGPKALNCNFIPILMNIKLTKKLMIYKNGLKGGSS